MLGAVPLRVLRLARELEGAQQTDWFLGAKCESETRDNKRSKWVLYVV